MRVVLERRTSGGVVRVIVETGDSDSHSKLSAHREETEDALRGPMVQLLDEAEALLTGVVPLASERS